MPSHKSVVSFAVGVMIIASKALSNKSFIFKAEVSRLLFVVFKDLCYVSYVPPERHIIQDFTFAKEYVLEWTGS